MTGHCHSTVLKAWGAPPDWILALAEACDETSQAAVARRLNVSSSQINQVLKKTYPSPLAGIEQAVRGAYMGLTVACRELGEIGRDRCLSEQVLPLKSTSPMRVRMYRACRSGCPHFRPKGGQP